MTKLEEAFFADLCRGIETWKQAAISAIEHPDSARWAECKDEIRALNQKNWNQAELRALGTLVQEVMAGVAHSILVAIDGGTALAETGRLRLVDAATGEDLSDGALHEDFADYQADRGLI